MAVRTPRAELVAHAPPDPAPITAPGFYQVFVKLPFVYMLVNEGHEENFPTYQNLSI